MTSANWGAGYVTDVPYLPILHPSQKQSAMMLGSALNCGAACMVGRNEPFHFCDIGSGFGVTALITAAANPGWQVTGLDFNPSHIAQARDYAALAGIPNVRFIEADLTSFATSPEAVSLPAFDAVTMHGVWSWVGRPVQDGILALLDAKLRTGGMLHVSYNLLTGWHSVLALRRLVYEAGIRLANRSDRQALAGFEVARVLADAGGKSVLDGPVAKHVLGTLGNHDRNYLAHEFMNETWQPVMHADVAARMAEIRLSFAGSPDLTDNFPDFVFNDAQRAVLAKFDDPVMTETFKDICNPSFLRHDLFARGIHKVSAVRRNEILGDVSLGLVAAPADWIFKVASANGDMELSRDYYEPILERLKTGPATVRDLQSLPSLTRDAHNPAELITVLIATQQVIAVPNPGAMMDDTCRRLNALLLERRFEAGDKIPAVDVAVPAVGGGMKLPFFEGAVLHELTSDPATKDPAALAARLGARQTAEERAQMADRIALFMEAELPLLRNFGFEV